MIQTVTTAILPEKELALKRFVETAAKDDKATVEEFYEKFADAMKKKPPSDFEAGVFIDRASCLRISRNEQLEVATGLGKHGLDARQAMVAVAALSLGAFLTPILAGMFGGRGEHVEQITQPISAADPGQPEYLPEKVLSLRPFMEETARKERKTVEQYLDETAAEAKNHPPSARDPLEAIDAASLLRVNAQDQVELAQAMESRGVESERIRQALVGITAVMAFIEPLKGTML